MPPADGSSLLPFASFPARASFDVTTTYPHPPSLVRSVKTHVPPTGTLETSGAGPPPTGVCEHSDARGAGAKEEEDDDEEAEEEAEEAEEFVASAAAAVAVVVAAAVAAAAALSLLATSVTENVCCCCCWESLLLLLAGLPPRTTHVNVGAPSTTALVPAGLAFLSTDPPSIATASDSLSPSEAMAGGPGGEERTGPILAASGSFSAAAAACVGVGVSVKANVVALGGPEAEYSMVPARLSVEVQGLAAALARVARARRSRGRSRCCCWRCVLGRRGGRKSE